MCLMLYSSLKNTVDQLPMFVFWKDQNLDYLGCNNRLANVLPINHANNIIQKDDYDLPWAPFSDQYREDDKRVLQGECIDKIEPCIFDKAITLIQLSKQPLLENNTVIGVMGLSRKIGTTTYESSSHICEAHLKTHFNQITLREAQILFFMIRGINGKEIASLLDLSVRTIEKYCDNIKIKFSCKSKSALIKKAYVLGFQHLLPEGLSTSLIKKAFTVSAL